MDQTPVAWVFLRPGNARRSCSPSHCLVLSRVSGRLPHSSPGPPPLPRAYSLCTCCLGGSAPTCLAADDAQVLPQPRRATFLGSPQDMGTWVLRGTSELSDQMTPVERPGRPLARQVLGDSRASGARAVPLGWLSSHTTSGLGLRPWGELLSSRPLRN